MPNHPFVARIRGEREILKLINGHIDLSTMPLSGLSREAILQWAERLRPMPASVRRSLIDRLLGTSATLRLGSSASHRGALVSAAPDRNDSQSEIAEIRN